MDEPTSPPPTTATELRQDEGAADQEGAAALNWQASDLAFLQPTNLHIPRIQRAWERKPLSPFKRQRFRVGKVWKRAGAPQRNSDSVDQIVNKPAKQARAPHFSSSTTAKPVKKIRLDSSFGVGVQVSQWDGGYSPVRKIITRSGATNGAEMLALSEEEESFESEELEDDATVEVVNEDGTVEELRAEDMEINDWEDEDQDQDTVDDEEDYEENGSDQELEDNNAIACYTHDNSSQTLEPDSPRAVQNPEEPHDGLASVQESPDHSQSEIQRENFDKNPQSDAESGSDATLASNVQPGLLIHTFQPLEPRKVVLPDGFVSPVKRPSISSRRAARLSSGSRRKTLPIQFAPASVAEAENYAYQPAEEASSVAEIVGAPGASECTENPIKHMTVDDNAEETTEQDDEEWEDIEESSPQDSGDEINGDDADVEMHLREGDAIATARDRHVAIDESNADVSGLWSQSGEINNLEEHVSRQPVSLVKPGPCGSSLNTTVQAQQPWPSVKRSPRRKSSSPLRGSTLAPSKESSHLIALTPIKVPMQHSSPFHNADDEGTISAEDECKPIPPERAASAPPEELRLSQQKTSRPRISDDTALLQAFLNRAAESKNEKRPTATQRETISNRRDSDVVRQALATPAKAEVLGDLDPNSPSTRKLFAEQDSVFNEAESTVDAVTNDEIADVALNANEPRTRRSARAARRARLSNEAASSVPNKISIRGNANKVVLKQTEAQQRTLETRNNTRKNKGGAVLPPVRLKRLAASDGQLQKDEPPSIDTEDIMSKRDGAKSVTWAEDLVAFQQGSETSEISAFSDEGESVIPALEKTEDDADVTVDGQAPPPACETPSKPRIRRLRPVKPTASTPAKLNSVSVASATANQEPEPALDTAKSKSGLARTRSRIATPAKALTNLSDDGPQSTMAEKKPGPGTRKAPPVSRLPAPSATSLNPGQGKENITLASPPKRKPSASATTAKGFAPRLEPSASSSSSGRPRLDLSVSEDATPVAGLMSPAKKGFRKGMLFASSAVATEGPSRRDDLPGLSSPAKKKTRRS